MLIVVMMGKWSDDSACWVVHDVALYSVLNTVVISGDDVCCSVVFGTLVGVFVFSVMWSELLMTSVSRRYINVYNWHMFSVDNVYLDHVKFSIVCIDG